MRSNSMPGWAKGLLAVLGLAVLGPPALILLIVALALTLKLSVAVVKVVLVVGVIGLVVAGLRAVFGKETPARALNRETSIDELAARLEAEEAERRAALDLELARSLSQTR
jgi:threonine/homoserine/homoserine lactone efflux protein